MSEPPAASAPVRARILSTQHLSLFGRTLLAVVIALMALWLILAIGFYRNVARTSLESVLPPARLAAITHTFEGTAPDQWRPLAAALSGTDLTVRVVADPFDPSPEGAPGPRYQEALGGRAVSVRSLGVEHEGRRATAMPPALSRDPLRVTVALRGGSTLLITVLPSRVLTKFGVPVGFGAGIVATLVALLALFVMHRQLRPLTRLARTADALDVSLDQRTLPLPRHAAPEIRSLIGAINRLQERLATVLSARMEMIGGISHDVRTFATRLSLRVERLDGPEQQRALADIQDMVRMLDDALVVSRAGMARHAEELCEVARLVSDEVADQRRAGAPVEVAVDATAGNALVLADPLAIRRIAANLIKNAITYGDCAVVTVAATAEHIVLTVDDDGPGIPTEQRARVFEPFVRLEGSRSRATGGAGLGLAVVRRLVLAHEGRIDLSDAPQGGLRVRVRLPLFRAEEG